MSQHICDICGRSFRDLEPAAAHLVDEHGADIDEVVELGSLEQRDGRLIIHQGDEVMDIDLAGWLVGLFGR